MEAGRRTRMLRCAPAVPGESGQIEPGDISSEHARLPAASVAQT